MSGPRMVHVLGSLDVGGAELRLLDLCRELRGTDPSATEQVFLTLAGRRGAIADRFEAVGARVEQCPLRPLWTFPARLLRAFRALAPTAVVSHVSLVSGLVLAVARAARVRTRIAWFRSDGDGRPDTLVRKGIRAVLRRLLRANATAVVAVNPVALRFGLADPQRWRRGVATVIPNGVDTSRFTPTGERPAARRTLGLDAGALVLLHVGRASPEKNRAFLVDVLAALRAQGVPAVLVLAGPGGSADVTAVHPDADRDPAVLFAGPRDDVPALLAAADVLLLPSTREGMPGALLEALSSGVPAVASDLPGPRELAAALPGVHIVDLAAGAAVWAQAVLIATDAAPERAELHAAVARSPYALASAAQVWRALW